MTGCRLTGAVRASAGKGYSAGEQRGQEGTGTVTADHYMPSKQLDGIGQLDGKVAVITGIAMLTAGSRAHYDYAVWPARRSAQAAPLALTRPKGA